MKPSGRFKRRYVSFSLGAGGSPPDFAWAKEAIHGHFIAFFGELGASSLAFKLVKYDPKSGKGILRCARDRVDETVFCMACMSEFQGKKCRLEPLSTSGSVRKA